MYRCGSGLSGDCLSEEGHVWIGVDISQPMLGKYYMFSHSQIYNYYNMNLLCHLSNLFNIYLIKSFFFLNR